MELFMVTVSILLLACMVTKAHTKSRAMVKDLFMGVKCVFVVFRKGK